MPGGRPTLFNEPLAEIICGLLTEGQSLRKICALESMPGLSTVCVWLQEKPKFLEQYRIAREAQHEILFDELLDLADDTSNDVSGELKMPNMVAVNRAKLRIDTRKWAISKILPKQYGDKIQAEHSGQVGLTMIHDCPRPARED